MATCNFRTQDGFPLFCTSIFDGYEYEDEETGATCYTDFDEWHFNYCQKKIDELNNGLKYYKITLESGYYCGVQVILEEQDDEAFTRDYTAKEWAQERKFYRRRYGYFYEFDLPYSERKKAESREIKRIIKFCKTVLKEQFYFDEYVCTARFSNGEALYEKASNFRARVKALAIA